MYVILIGFIGFVNMLFSGKRTLKYTGDGSEGKIKELSDVLVKGRIAFLDLAIVSMEITAFQILDNVTKMSIQLEDLSNHFADAGK